MGAAGPNSGGTFANDTSVGTRDWANLADAASSNDTKAYTNFPSSGITSHYLKATNFGFAIPTGATIDGILVEIEKMNTPDYPGVVDNSVKIVKGGTIQGDEKKLTGAWGTSDAYYSYGDATSLWGLAWTPADINSSTFGIVISCYKSDSWGNAQVDHIRITVYYTPPISLVIADASHAHSADASSPLVEHKTLAMADSAHTLLSDNLDLTQVHNLSIADGGHTLVSDSLTLTQLHNLLISGCGHVLASDVIVLLRTYLLSVRDGRHNLTSDSFVLGQEYYNWGTPRLALDDDGDWIYRKKQ